MWELFVKGGPIMYLLLLCSVSAVYIIIQKYLFLSVQQLDDDCSIESIQSQLLSEGKELTLETLRKKRKIIPRVWAAIIKLSDLNRDDIKDAIKEHAIREMQKLEKNMSLLTSIITIAPILGLMGTVLGIMDIFNVISGGHIGKPELLSRGIAEALITTVTGLGIAIPCILLHQQLRNKIDTLLLSIEQSAYALILFCKSQTIQK